MTILIPIFLIAIGIIYFALYTFLLCLFNRELKKDVIDILKRIANKKVVNKRQREIEAAFDNGYYCCSNTSNLKTGEDYYKIEYKQTKK
jgi:hypothetical protein